MKVLIVNNLPEATGVGGYAHTIFNALGNDVDLVSFPNYSDFTRGTFSGTVMRPISHLRSVNLMTSRFMHRSTIKNIKNFDGIVHYAGYTMSLVGFRNKSNTVGTVHDFFPMELNSTNHIYQLYMRHNLRKMLRLPNIIVATEYMKNKLLSYKFNGNVFVAPFSYSRLFRPLVTNFSGKLINSDLNTHYVLSVSTNNPQKNLGILPRVMDILGDKYKLVRVGTKIGDSITFEYCDTTQLNEIYNSCDVLIYPSLTEGFGYPLIEALAVGLPVAASDIPVFREIAGDAVEYFDPHNPEEAAEAVRRIMSNREYYVRKSLERGKLYSPEVFARNMRKIYSTIAHAK